MRALIALTILCALMMSGCYAAKYMAEPADEYGAEAP